MEEIGEVEIGVMGKSESQELVSENQKKINSKLLQLPEPNEYQPKFDEEYLNSLIKKAKHKWKNIDADEWLFNVRGGYEA